MWLQSGPKQGRHVGDLELAAGRSLMHVLFHPFVGRFSYEQRYPSPQDDPSLTGRPELRVMHEREQRQSSCCRA